MLFNEVSKPPRKYLGANRDIVGIDTGINEVVEDRVSVVMRWVSFFLWRNLLFMLGEVH